MAEHIIRLRAAWQGVFESRLGEEVRRIDLPAFPAPVLEGISRLERRFQSPRITPEKERLLLRLKSMPDLLAVRLNGQEILRGAPPEGGVEIELPPLTSGSNRLVLDLDRHATARRTPGASWGEVTLVIRSIDRAQAVGEADGPRYNPS